MKKINTLSRFIMVLAANRNTLPVYALNPRQQYHAVTLVLKGGIVPPSLFPLHPLEFMPLLVH